MPQFAHLKCSDIITGQDEVWKKNGFRYNLISSDIILDGGNAVIAGKRVILTDKINSEKKEILFDVRGKDFEKYAWAYINFLQVGNKILVPSLGLPCEESVMNQIRQYFPNCIVDSIEMREVVDEGGALHCITWNIKK